MTEPDHGIDPLLLRADGRRIYYSQSRPYLAAIIDRHGKNLCWVCLDAIMPIPYKTGLAHAHHPRAFDGGPAVIWWFPQVVTDEVRAKAEDYFQNPVCSLETHASHERRQLARREKAYFKAWESLAEMSARPAGWSIELEENR